VQEMYTNSAIKNRPQVDETLSQRESNVRSIRTDRVLFLAALTLDEFQQLA